MTDEELEKLRKLIHGRLGNEYEPRHQAVVKWLQDVWEENDVKLE